MLWTFPAPATASNRAIRRETPAGCRWTSLNPGVTVWPFRSTILVVAVARRRISALVPTADEMAVLDGESLGVGFGFVDGDYVAR